MAKKKKSMLKNKAQAAVEPDAMPPSTPPIDAQAAEEPDAMPPPTSPVDAQAAEEPDAMPSPTPPVDAQAAEEPEAMPPPTPPVDDYENDPRPESSPYTKACCYLSVGPNRIPYTVPTHYLKKSPRFSHQLVYYSGGRTIEEPELDEDIGHTLVHFLYTDEYQTLKRPILRKVEDEATEYRRSVLVYQTASKYELPLLMEHAKENIGKFDDAASVFEALDIAKVVYDKLQGGDEVWFYNYLKRKLKDAFDADEILFAQDKFIGFIDESPMFSRMLVKLVVEIYSDTLSRTRIENDQAEESDHHDRLLNESSELEYSEPATEDRPEPVVEEEPEPAPDEVPEPAPEEEPEEMPDWEPAAPEEAPLEPESAPEIEPVLEIEPEPELAVALSPVHDTGDFWPPRAMMKDKKKGGINGVFSSI